MKINRNLRLQLLLQNWLFVLVFLILMVMLGYLASQYRFAKDITQANRNLLTQGSVNILNQMKGPIDIKVYATNDDADNGDTFRKGVVDFVARYQRAKKDTYLTFINPSEEPKLAQEAGVKVDGETVVEFNKRVEHINPPFAEQEMTNLLVRLSRTNTQPIMYLDGHGERNLLGTKNTDLGAFGQQLESKGFKFSNPDLTIAQEVPSNGAMLVIAAPKVDVTEVEAQKILAYIEAGGNVLWLMDDNNERGLKIVADYLGLSVSPGIVVDKSALQYKVDPKVAFVSNYGDHPITKNFMLRTMFPEAHEVDAKASFELGWKVAKLVDVAPNGWLESDVIPPNAKNLKVSFDKSKDKPGPINIGVALEREYGKKGQRIVVMGNANFLTNTFVTSVGNLDFGINIINWLAGDDKLITIQPMPLKDVNINIPSGSISALVIGYGTQYVLPVLFFIFGMFFWWKRRKA
jgi:ABC-type uncharacterized transport system involved in gliding motility auxiliary subunit